MYLSPFGEVTPPVSQFVRVLLVSLLQLLVLVLCQHHLLLVLRGERREKERGRKGRERERGRKGRETNK